MLKFIKNISSLFIMSLFFVVQVYAQKTISGVVTEEIKTKNGVIKIIRTDHLPKGKTISGTVVVEPESDNPKKRVKQLAKLAETVLLIGGEVIANNGTFTTTLPDFENVPLQVFSDDGKIIDEIILELSDPIENVAFDFPKTICAEKIEKITGEFSGDISEAKLTVENQALDVLAGNESELFFEANNIEPGKQDLLFEYNDLTATVTANIVEYTLQAGKLNLNRGESTYLDIQVVGLEDMQEPLNLKIENQSLGTISIEGGDKQIIRIGQKEVTETGVWKKRLEIQSLARGSFSVFTDLEIPENESEESENAAEYVEQVLATGNKTGVIGKMKLVNTSDKIVDATLYPCYIPSEDVQSFSIPEKQNFNLHPNSEETFDLNGFCNDFEMRPPKEGAELADAGNWIQVEDVENVEKIRNLLPQETLIPPLQTDVNIPGTNIPVKGMAGFAESYELKTRILLLGLQQIIEAYDQLETEEKLSNGFSEKSEIEKVKTVQTAFWDYAEKLKGKQIDKKLLEETLEAQMAENLWQNIELIGEKAKLVAYGNKDEKGLELTVEEDLSLSFVESTYAKFDVDELEFTKSNRLLNFENEKILLLLIPDESDLEDPVWIQLDTSKSKWKKMKESDIVALGTEFMDYCKRFSPPCPPGCKGHNPMYGTGLVIPDDSCIPSDVFR